MDETTGAREISQIPTPPVQDLPNDVEPKKELEKLSTGKEMSTQTDEEITIPRILTTEIGIQTEIIIETQGLPIREMGIQTEEEEKSEKSPQKEEKRVIKNRKIQRDRGLHNLVKWGIILFLAARWKTSEAKPVPHPIGNTDNGMDNMPTVGAYDCAVPRSTRVFQSERKCTLATEEMMEMEPATIYQEIAETRMKGFMCRSTITTHVRYCGVFSYTQTLPLDITAEPVKVTAEECREWTRERAKQTQDGEKHIISVPGITEIFVQTAGAETIEGGTMRYQGENVHLKGQFLKDVVMEETIRIEIREENFVAVKDEIIAVRDGVQIQCHPKDRQCAGEEKTYVWEEPDTTYQLRTVSRIRGRKNTEKNLFVSETALAVFNISRGVRTMLTEWGVSEYLCISRNIRDYTCISEKIRPNWRGSKKTWIPRSRQQ